MSADQFTCIVIPLLRRRRCIFVLHVCVSLFVLLLFVCNKSYVAIFFSNYSVYVLKVEIYSLFCHDIMLGSIIVFLFFLPTFSNKFLSKKLFIHYSLHYLFRHTKRLDLFSYQSEVNLMLNNDFVYFQPTCFKFHQRFPSNYCLGMTLTYFFVPFGLKLPVECRF